MQTYIITYPKDFSEPGGGTKSFLQICQYLKKLDIEVIAVPVSTSSDGNSPDKSLTVKPAHPSSVHFLLNGFQISKVVRKIIAERKVDAVLSWEYEAAFMVDFLKSKNIVFGIIAAYPSYQVRINREKSINPTKRISNYWFRWRPLQSADVVFVSSYFTQNELVNLIRVQPERVVLIRRGIDPVFSQIKRSQSGHASNFIFYGSLAPIKGIFDVIKALGHLLDKGYRDWHLKIAGWGDEELLRQAISEHNCDNNVTYLGSLSRDKLLRELEWAGLAILPSRAESFGRSIAEAQAAGLPVISYESGSVPEIVKDGITGFLAPTGRFDLLADAILKAIKEPEDLSKMGLLGQERVMQSFSWEKTALAIHQGIQAVKGSKVV
ncbi:glycosyltransferase family 4 protein [Leptothoe spongobia]|uniref:Glycosyltransferase family 4 protein n=1 Tax=Leptothoe spongobia TAU-MAC 1115 TaxID=1967444 RepID=A0A947DIJ2_9CYAN|nr:glycosyltransferase family 4 protein [Leptothoe spongobia]MBT9317284.1 glycosyltransferase family 4 protein [Leptothoe spongobia TAU-MAC 1115]